MVKANRVLLIDTETVGVADKLVYDIAAQVVDKRGKVYASLNYMVREIATNADYMMGAFYASKVFTSYLDMLDDGAITLAPWQSILNEIAEMVREHDVNIFSAYNLDFDRAAIRDTSRFTNADKVLNRPLKKLCLYRFACETVLSQRTYARAALENGWISEAGNMRTNAECAYRYISGEWDLIESHTALDDVRIEREIMVRCFQQKSAIPYDKPSGQSWRIVNPQYKGHRRTK